MARPRQYSVELQAVAVAAVLGGASLTAVAKQLGVSKAIIVKWRSAAAAQNAELVTAVERGATVNLGALVADYLAANLRALTTQARAVAEPSWIEKQDAYQIVAVHNALADRAVRILGAIDTGDPADQPE